MPVANPAHHCRGTGLQLQLLLLHFSSLPAITDGSMFCHNASRGHKLLLLRTP